MKLKSLLTAIGIASLVVSLPVEATGYHPPPPPPPKKNSFSGQAFVAKINALGIKVSVVDTGPLPSTGGSITQGLPELNILGLISARLLTAKTSGGGSTANSSATVADLEVGVPLPILLGALDISALVLAADSKATCKSGKPSVSGSSTIADLVVLGAPITVTGKPNQTIDVLGLAKVVVNEQKKSIVGKKGAITVNALHVTVGNILPILPPIADVIVSSAHSDIKCI